MFFSFLIICDKCHCSGCSFLKARQDRYIRSLRRKVNVFIVIENNKAQKSRDCYQAEGGYIHEPKLAHMCVLLPSTADTSPHTNPISATKISEQKEALWGNSLSRPITA